jgi:hypothetical protein
VSGFIAKCLATPPLPPSRSSLGPPGTCTDGFARALARFIALQLPKDGHVRGFAVEDHEMEPRRHGEIVGGSGARARVLAHAARVCACRLVDAIASCSRSVRG